ncbi:MAG: histidinol-phosphate transaminase [Candidatus Marinimicrobia bacterium]|nr:histidinol-phosphate transaminase [Candidatus Neomarinimicrobiota bacterium]|tara:strand:- start:1174 stop:2271 length:1098 start_codon:yes stop_codon:yes gene_type:complete
MTLVPKHIKNLFPYKAGKPIEEVKRQLGLKKIIKLASNENPLGPSKIAIKAVEKILLETHRYPDSNGYDLRSRLAEKFDLNIDNVIIGGGSEGIMSVIMRTFLSSKDEIIATKNSFIGFKVLANASGIKTNWVSMKNYHYSLESMANKINDYTKVIYLANPDNPTGTYFNKNSFDDFMSKVPNRVIVILDEAYFEYASDKADYPDSMHYRYDNVITLRTFSKIHGLAGFRVGYGFANSNLITNLMKVKLPFEPSTLGQVAACAALNDEKHLMDAIKINNSEKLKLESFFKENNMKYIPSVTNFLTLRFGSSNKAENFCNNLLKKGIILRHLAGFGLPECVRVTIGIPNENKYLVNQIKKLEIECI